MYILPIHRHALICSRNGAEGSVFVVRGDALRRERRGEEYAHKKDVLHLWGIITHIHKTITTSIKQTVFLNLARFVESITLFNKLRVCDTKLLSVFVQNHSIALWNYIYFLMRMDNNSRILFCHMRNKCWHIIDFKY